MVGGGPIAEGKVRNLMKHPCEVVLISPQATNSLARWAGEERIEWERRTYREGDLKGAFLAIGATGVLEVDRQMAEEAERERVLLNIVDYVPLCMFIAPSIVERGPVTFAISTSGASPALARKLRESMEKSELLDFAEDCRPTVEGAGGGQAARVENPAGPVAGSYRQEARRSGAGGSRRGSIGGHPSTTGH